MKIRVLHIIDSLDLGGAQTVLLNLVRQIDRERFELEVATMHGRGVFWEAFEQLGIELHSLSPHKAVPLYLPKLMALLARRRFSIVHCHLFGSNWIAKPLAALLGVPVRISHDHCNDALRYEQGWARRFDTLTNRLSTHVCAVSRSTRDFLVETQHLPEERVSLVYNGVDLERFAPPAHRPKRERFVVLGVGRLVAQKNFTLFLQVAAQLLAEGLPITFRIAGTGPEEAELRAQAAQLAISAQVEFLGHVQDTPQLYADADALLLTSRFEGTPMTALEAMANRLPIVASRLDGLAEILVDDHDALLADSEDGPGFALQIRRLIEQPALAERLSSAAQAKVQARYSAAAMTGQVEAIYERSLLQSQA